MSVLQFHQMAGRYGTRLVLALSIALWLANNAVAQPASLKSGAIVLVLNLVSATHVKPTTGLVVSANGWVVVPAGFATSGDEIVVLDGGTDIARYARPATIIERPGSTLLMLLEVKGLNRAPIKLAEQRQNNGSTAGAGLHLSAYPPAARIAAGEPPLWIPIEVADEPSSGKFSIAAATPLPNVTGVIIDRCGLLLGLNLASGAQSLATDSPARTVFSSELVRAMGSVGISLSTTSCRAPDQAQQQATVNAPTQSPQARDEADTSIATRSETDNAQQEMNITATDNKDLLPMPDTGGIEIHKPVQSIQEAASQPVALWVWILALLVFSLAALFAIKHFLGRAKRSNESAATPGEPAPTINFDEPDTAALQTTTNDTLLGAAATQGDANELPDINTLPAGLDALVVVEGQIKDVRFRRFCMANSSKIDIVIGRSGADINIESPAISRAHVRLEGSEHALTLSDLGSHNGSFIKGIPCLPGEIMYIESGDEIQLAKLRLQLKIITKAVEMP